MSADTAGYHSHVARQEPNHGLHQRQGETGRHRDTHYFFERNPTERGLNPVKDTYNTDPLPPLGDLSRGAAIQMRTIVTIGHHAKRELETPLRTSGTPTNMFPNKDACCLQDLSRNTHLGANKAMTPWRAKDNEGAKPILLSYKSFHLHISSARTRNPT